MCDRLLARREPLTAAGLCDDELLQRVLGDRVVLESLPEVVCVLDRDLIVLYLNRSVPGRYLPELIGTSVLDYIPLETRARYREAFEGAWLSGEVHCLEFSSILNYSWQSRFVPVREEGEVVLMLVTSLDVTDRVAAERALRGTIWPSARRTANSTGRYSLMATNLASCVSKAR